MTTTVIQLRDLDAAIRKAISERGEDYIYPQIDGICFYRSAVTTDEFGDIEGSYGPAGCIVGYAYDDLGVLPEVMDYRSMWEPGDGPTEGAAASQLARALDLRFEHDGRDVTSIVDYVLNCLQGKQDCGDTWSTAYVTGWLGELRTSLYPAYEEFRKTWAER